MVTLGPIFPYILSSMKIVHVLTALSLEQVHLGSVRTKYNLVKSLAESQCCLLQIGRTMLKNNKLSKTYFCMKW
jgi:hypothetical protein